MAFLLTASIGVVLIVSTVLIHHEALRLLVSTPLIRTRVSHRWKGCLIVLVLMGAHIAEVELYALGLYISSDLLGLGHIVGENASLTTWSYFSFTCYTSLGIGDIVPHGHVRLLAGIEALNGLVLIGWTASFLLVEMRERRVSVT